MSAEVHETSVDGVPVVWAGGAATDTMNATFLFGVGWHHQDLLTRGIDDVVLGCAVGQVGYDVAVEWEYVVDGELSQVAVSGAPVAVAWFLGRLCHALTDLDLSRKAAVARDLEHDEPDDMVVLERLMLRERFGPFGPGAGVYGAMASTALTDAQVRRRAREWYHRGNASLVLDGPPPPELRLPLPAGTAPCRTPPPLRPLPPGSWRPHVLASCYGASVLLPASDPAPITGMRAVGQRCKRAAHGAQAEVANGIELMDADRLVQVCIVAVQADDLDPVMAHTMVEALLDMAREGPTDEELAARVVAEKAYAHGGAGRQALAASVARARLLGVGRDDRTFAADVARLTAADVAGSLRSPVHDTTLVLVPKDRLPRRYWGESAVMTDGEIFRPKSRLLSARWSRPSLTVSPTHAAVQDETAAVSDVRLADVVAHLYTADGRHVLVDADGGGLQFDEAEWRAGGRIAELLRQRVRPDVRLEVAWL